MGKSKTENSRKENYGLGIHGGASADSEFVRKNQKAYLQSLEHICNTGYEMIRKKTSALDTVFELLKLCEDEPLFNSGRGAALNELGKVHMDAAVMEGRDLRAGAVTLIENVKNPSQLIREILKDASHIFLGGEGAIKLAAKKKLTFMPDSYFITDVQVEAYLKKKSSESISDKLRKKMNGTNGIVVVDRWGNVAAGSTTGGTANSLEGRIGDTCVLGAGCYANNSTCAVVATGDGEFIIQGVVAHYVSCYLEMKGGTIQEACDYVVHERNKNIRGDLGVIGIDPGGNIGIAFNSERMHRAWMSKKQKLQAKIYR
jgi:beta-aspartyl-peptidase (threonine type)